MLHIIKRKKIWLTISGVMVVVGLVALGLWQLKLGIDYTGGSVLELSYRGERPANTAIAYAFERAGVADAEIRTIGQDGVLIRFKTIGEDVHQRIVKELKTDQADFVEKSFDSIGPVIGQELKSKSLLAILVALAMILLYITFVFRKVSFPVASWKYGLSAIVALFHDLLFVLGIFAVLGKFAGIELTSTFIPAFLTVLGFSVHDTIVVFDRIRENLMKYKGDFEEIVEKSINETIVRSINTSLTVLLVLLAIYLLGGETLKSFSLALLLGIGVGTYSSIFVASPILVVWHQWSARGR